MCEKKGRTVIFNPLLVQSLCSFVCICGQFTVGSACAFAALFLTPLHQTATESLPLASTALLDFLLPVLALGLSWFSLNHATRWVLQKRYPEASLRLGQKIGKIGAGTMTGIVLAYLALLASAPHKPSWLLWVMGV